MATTQKDKPVDTGEEITIEPVILTNIKVKTIEKKVMFPVFVPVDVDKVSYVNKEYERPVIYDKEYERPVPVDKPYERPVIVDKEYERPVVTDKEYERAILVDKDYERPVIVEKEYPIPVPKEVSYDLPIVSMGKVHEVAKEAVLVLKSAGDLLQEVNHIVEMLHASVAKVKESIPKEIVMPNIIYEDHTVKNVKIVEETVNVIGKIVARSK